MPLEPGAAIEISAFLGAPFAQGPVRDLRVRWALGKAGLACRERLLDAVNGRPGEGCPEQPFGQVPTRSAGNLRMSKPARSSFTSRNDRRR